MPLSAAQQALNSFRTATITYLGNQIKIHGKSATLQYLGLVPDSTAGDIATTGESLTVQVRSYRRARWLGDSNGPLVPAKTVQKLIYPVSSGNAQPGRPFQFRAVSDTGGDTKGRKVTGTLSISGAWGEFVAYMTANRPPHSVYLKPPGSGWTDAPLLSDADFDDL